MMKIFSKQTFEQVKDFVIKHHIKIILITTPIFSVIVFAGMIAYNQIPSTCLSCHYVKGQYVAIDLKSEPHKGIEQGGVGCMSCHPDKAVEKWAMRGVSKAKTLSQRFANLKFTEPTDPKASYTSEQCIKCHPDRLDVMERPPHLLASEKLAEIGLMLNKRLHYQYELFRHDDQMLYQQLQAAPSLTDEEHEQLVLLDKIRVGNCGVCHVREKIDQTGKKFIDKTVNFSARNPITCAGCHENVTSVNHPGKPLPAPTKEVCQKCHHGKIHGRFVIFRAECEDLSDQTNCTKCHPYYVPENPRNWVTK